MKNLTKLILLLSISVFSCSDFLDEKPVSFYTPDNYYTSYQQAQNAVNGIYAFTRDFYSPVGLYEENAMLMLENPTGQAKSDINQSNNNANLRNLKMQTTDLYFRVWWRSSYKGIGAANLAIQKIPLIPSSVVTEAQKSQLLGQAKFLRAWFYFNLVRIFGDVPLVSDPTTSATGLQIPRTATKEIYEKLIVPDLLAAEQSGLPMSDNSGRVANGAVKSLLAKVYQTMAGFPLKQNDKLPLAKQKALEVINSGKFTLYQNYNQFRDQANDNKLENIFMVQYASTIASNPMFAFTLPSFSLISNGQQEIGTLLPDDAFFESYKESDLRKQERQFFYSHAPNFSTGVDVKFKNGPHIFKYWDDVAQSSGQGSGKSFPIIRLSDIMLLYAEVQNEVDGSPDANSYDYINAIRTRATLAPLAGLSKDQFREAVWRERNHELCFENQTWFDMVRTRMVYDTKNDAFVPMVGYAFPRDNTIKFQEKHYLFPIPQDEMNANPKLGSNNPGY